MSVTIEGFMDKKNDSYVDAIQEHVRECVEELNEYSADLPKLVNKDFRAVERDLQILIEAGIGIAKRLVKKQNKIVPVGAYENFQKLGDLKFITSDELKKWEKIIGLRNVLVHDYLKVNREVIKTVLKKKEYLFIQDFVQKNLSEI